jgi:hypothetical protein
VRRETLDELVLVALPLAIIAALLVLRSCSS